MSKISLLLSFLFLVAITCVNGAAAAAVEEDVPEFLRSRELASCKICPEEFLGKPGCGSFAYKAQKIWDLWAEGAEANSGCQQRCCAASEDLCCLDYTTGYWVGFIVGMVGLGLLIIYCIFDCLILPRRKAASDE